jgi:hypothetical protein
METNTKKSIKKTLEQLAIALPVIAGGIDGFYEANGVNSNLRWCTSGIYSGVGAIEGIKTACDSGEGMLSRAFWKAADNGIVSAVGGFLGYGAGYVIGSLVKGGNK